MSETFNTKALPQLPDYACLSKKDVLTLTGLSRFTLDRLNEQGHGPPRVWLSARRVGYPVGAFRDWLKQRTEKFGKTAA